ncbi:hypothetical protein [Hymenobacter fodinae]|uniref:hypothetical protein n=1 Tax=Hymenobacter fodinae TaxID=2510796 RepID=UPI001436A25F|nr:hypothetical protein [Hymenobacter fodinae]
MALPTKKDYQLPTLGEHITAKKRAYQQAVVLPTAATNPGLPNDQPTILSLHRRR